MARMQALAVSDPPLDVDLVYSTTAVDDGFVDEVRCVADAAGVRFHLVGSRKDGLVDLARIADWVPGWRETDVWFCGPRQFGESLRKAMVSEGLAGERFHQELFEMR